ncbi:MAG: hypothetical protein PHD01_17860 [Geobacteraceae bacterium]|nr:hypothetical protein [Geobacteraceae bacterium]
MKNIPAQKVNPNLLLIIYFLFKTTPVLISAGAIYLGYRLFILGVTGEASISINSNTISGQLLNAAPGLFFAMGGIVSLIISVWKGVLIHFKEKELSILKD